MSDIEARKSQPGSPALTQSRRASWVQTDRQAHEAWGDMVRRNPRAAVLLHKLVAHMDQSGAVVASQGTLAKLCGYSSATVKRAIADLRGDRWIEVLQIGGKGGACAYVVNSRVAWADSRERLPMARFTARVLVSLDEQHQLETTPLRRIPTLMHPGEQQLPTGPGEDPPSQPALAGLEPDLPSLPGGQDPLHMLRNEHD